VKTACRRPPGKAQWDIQSIRKLLKRDLYRPHTYAEMRKLVAPDALARLEPDKNYGVYWFGERAETRKRVSENGESERVYRHRYTSSVRPVADRVGVPVPDSGIPREWVDGARANLKNNRRPANAGRRLWDLSAGILHCSECGRAMSPRTANRAYFYYACTVGPSKRHHGCSAKKFHPAAELEERVWSAVSAILTTPRSSAQG
jgi:recombinase-like zinc beta ribbon protein